jgi:hypothetical protein
MSNEQPEFEDGKQVEDYVAELNKISDKLAIEPDKFPEGQPIENVAEIIEKPAKKKTNVNSVSSTASANNPTPQSPPVIVASPSTEVITQVNPNIVPPAQVTAPPQVIEAKPAEPTPTVPLEKPTENKPTSSPQQTPRLSVDQYIEALGEQAKQQTINNCYTNLSGLFSGRFILQPVQQTQPEPEPEPQPNILAELQGIEIALKEPANRPYFKQLIQRKCQLLGIPFEESMLQPVALQPIAQQEPAPPISSKLSETKKEKPKRSGMSKVKLIASGVTLALVVTLAVVLIIAQLSH